MNIAGVIAKLPRMSEIERSTVRGRATAWLQSGSDAQRQDAQAVLAALQEIESNEAAALVEHVRHLPKAKRVAEAFSSTPMTETERAVVQVLLDHPGSTSTALTAALGWGGQAWHMHFGTMCFNRRARLWPAPPAEKRNADFYSGILADFDPATSSFMMNAEAAEGFAALGLHARASAGS